MEIGFQSGIAKTKKKKKEGKLQKEIATKMYSHAGKAVTQYRTSFVE